MVYEASSSQNMPQNFSINTPKIDHLEVGDSGISEIPEPVIHRDIHPYVNDLTRTRVKTDDEQCAKQTLQIMYCCMFKLILVAKAVQSFH